MASNTEHTTLVCLFHHTDRAERTVQELLEIGIPQSSITLLGHARETADIDTRTATLESINVPEGDRQRLMQGLRDGGSIVAVAAPPGSSDEIEEIFRRYSADKIDEKVMTTSDVASSTGTGVPASAFPSVVTAEYVDMPAAQRVITVNPPVLETISAPPADVMDIGRTRTSMGETVVIADPADLIEDSDGLEPTSATTFRFDPDAPVDQVRNPAADPLNDPLNRR